MTHQISRRYTFSAAHILPRHPGKCSRLHGHNYDVEVVIEDDIADNGMILDFEQVDESVNPILKSLDHHTLVAISGPTDIAFDESNVVIPLENGDVISLPKSHCCMLSIEETTAELLSAWIFNTLTLTSPSFTPAIVRVWETNRCMAETRG